MKYSTLMWHNVSHLWSYQTCLNITETTQCWSDAICQMQLKRPILKQYNKMSDDPNTFSAVPVHIYLQSGAAITQANIMILHYTDVMMNSMASQTTSLTVVYSIVYSDADERKHQSSASLAFVWEIHRDRWISRTKGQLRGKFSIWWRHHDIQQYSESSKMIIRVLTNKKCPISRPQVWCLLWGFWRKLPAL